MESSTKNPILAVRLRGTASDDPDVRRTMESLKLERTFQARLLENTPSNLGMLRSAKVLVAWGEVSPDLLGRVLEKRGERSEEHTSELQSQFHLVCRLLLEKKN